MSRHLPEDERELVELAASCNDDAFSALMTRFQRLMAHIISRTTNDPEDRQDLRSEIIARLLTNRKKPLRDWRPTAPFAAYLGAIASRHCYSWSAQRGLIDAHPGRCLSANTSTVEPELLDHFTAESSVDTPVDALDRSERAELLRTAISQLPDDDRLILKLSFLDEYSGPTIADILGISHGAARQRIFRALRRLERILSETEPGYFE
jgi:RNA polymerase sigma factor (sigma-70 family)